MSGCLNEYQINKWYDSTTNIEKQIEQSRSYLDEQLEWYSNFLSENCTQIYMSDHGRRECEGYYHSEERSHVMMMLCDKNIKASRCTEMYSHLNFINVIKYIFDESCYDKIFSEYISLQSLDIYSKELVDTVINKINDKYKEIYLQYRGIRTKEDIYIKYVNGKKIYFRLPDEENNQINNKEYESRINYLRNIAGNYFIDIYEDDYFIEVRSLYEKLGIKKQNK